MKKTTSASPTAAKERLLEAALKIFALHGYEGASTRQLAQAANVNISAIPYYFHGKEGLYQATLLHIANFIKGGMINEAASHVRALLERKGVSAAEYRAALHALIGEIVRFLLDDKVSAHAARIFLREQMEPTQHFNLLYDDMMRPMHEKLTELVARLTRLPFPSEQATLCAHTLLGQIIIFKTHREAALRRLSWKKYGPEEKEKIIETILRHTDFILDMYAQNAPRKRL